MDTDQGVQRQTIIHPRKGNGSNAIPMVLSTEGGQRRNQKKQRTEPRRISRPMDDQKRT